MTHSTTGSQLKSFLADPRIVAFLNYALLIFMPLTYGLTGIVVLLISTFVEDKAADWIKTHYEFQKRTFWLGILPILATVIVTIRFAQVLPKPVTPALVILTLILVAGRCVMGFNHLFYNRAYPNPKTWTV
jgi:uncharacterized membrane protein